MALRAFHANPSIGGFGGESTSTVLLLDPKRRNNKQQPLSPQQNSDGDALCQIVKELVDNAVDACEAIRTEEQEEQEREEQEETPTNKKCLRVKVGIVPYNTTTTTDDNKKGNPDILQVTISDNGCGMADIQNCVDAFQSSKNGGGDTRTAGRYGIGLTLCLLHAQRLVPNSYACITSATKEQRNFTRALYVVDTQGDSVECHQQVEIPKTHNDESGTCVSLLVPGGTTAELAWARLANYFARFRLSTGLRCSLECLAPSLSKVPVFVRTQHGRNKNAKDRERKPDSEDSDHENHHDREEDPWIDGFEDGNHCETDDDLVANNVNGPNREAGSKRFQAEREAILTATRNFMGCPSIKLKNIAVSIQPIRLGSARPLSATAPKLEVDVVITPHRDQDLEREEDTSEPPVARLELVRLVNNVPLLDGAEASACGIVQGITNKVVWGCSGLQVTKSCHSDVQSSWTPRFDVRDSDQVAPFFQSHTHRQWEAGQDLDSIEEDPIDGGERRQRKRKSRMMTQSSLLPAKVRLGHILVIVHIRAAPSSLPLPTLSKGRLPLNHAPIDQALQLGLRDCLRSIQGSNPSLLLTPAQLRVAEREIRYMPAVACAVSRILGRMSNKALKKRLLDTIGRWKNNGERCPGEEKEGRYAQKPQSKSLDATSITIAIEQRLKKCVLDKQQSTLTRKTRRQKKVDNQEKEYSDLDRSDEEDQESDENDSTTDSQKKKIEDVVATESLKSWDDSVTSSKPLSLSESEKSGCAHLPKEVTVQLLKVSDEDKWW